MPAVLHDNIQIHVYKGVTENTIRNYDLLNVP